MIRTKKLFSIGLEAMCGARIGELQTSHVSISLQNTFKLRLWASHWTTCSYIEPCSIVSWGHHMIYTTKEIVRPQFVKWCEWVNELGWWTKFRMIVLSAVSCHCQNASDVTRLTTCIYFLKMLAEKKNMQVYVVYQWKMQMFVVMFVQIIWM
jgi:hypothetical protein